MSNLNFLSGKGVDHEVNGQSLRFYPVSMRLAFQMRSFLAPLARSLSSLLANDKDDTRLTGYENRTVTQADGSVMQTTEVSPIRPEVLQQLEAKRNKALDDLVQAMTSEENSKLFARLIMDSLRDNEYPTRPNSQQVEEFIAGMDTGSFFECVVGFTKANKKVFDPFLAKVAPDARAAASEAAAGLVEKVKAATMPAQS